jgi:lysophospholipase L1-like esterase
MRGPCLWLFSGVILISGVLGAGGCVDLRIPDPDVRYLAFGESSTAGPSERDYPDILRERLGEPPETFANEGQGGETSREGLERLRDLIELGIYPNAEVLLYWEGGNDITDFIEDRDPFLLTSPADPDYPITDRLTGELDDIQSNVEAAIRAGREAGMTVYVATYYLLREDLDRCDALPLDIILPSQARRANDYLTLLNTRIRRAAEGAGAVLVDVESRDAQLRGDADNYHNCNHLSAKGNEIVADLFYNGIQFSWIP